MVVVVTVAEAGLEENLAVVLKVVCCVLEDRKAMVMVMVVACRLVEDEAAMLAVDETMG